MIRRLVAMLALALGLTVLLPQPASADGYVLCAWNVNPLNVGVCVGV